MMGDDADASDVLQQAFLVAAANSSRIPHGEPWAWFCTVVVNCARNARRVRSRRLARFVEDSMESPREDGRAVDPADAAAGHELGLLVRGALEQLPEAERDALTLTHLGGLSTREAGEALGIPQNTVKSHCHRGMGRLRESLGARGEAAGERGLATALSAMPVAMPAAGLASVLGGMTEAARGMATAAGYAATGSTATGVGVTTGAVMMANKGVMAAVLAVGLVVGGASGALVVGAMSDGDGDGGRRAVAESASGLSVGVSGSGGEKTGASVGGVEMVSAIEFASLRSQVSELVAERDGLRGRAAQAEKAHAEAMVRVGEAESKLAAVMAKAAPKLTVSFGSQEQQEALASANWASLAESLKDLIAVSQETARLQIAGESVPRDLELRLINVKDDYRRRTAPIQLAASDALKGFGEFGSEALTHPLYLTNIIAGLLQAGGHPLEESQLQRLSGLGDAFIARWDLKQKEYGEDTLKLDRIADELELKQQFVKDALEMLTEPQAALLGDKSMRGLRGADPLAPLLIIQESWELYYAHDKPALKFGIMNYAAKLAGVDASFMSGADFLFEAYLNDLGDLTKSMPFEKASRFTADEAVRYVRAQTKLMRQFLQAMPMSDQVRDLIRSTNRVMIMRLVPGGLATDGVYTTDDGK